MTEYVNNHIHTTYSFSPYTPAQAVAKAKESGLITAGIMDHDSMGGAKEFIEAGKAEKIAVTVGFECRVRMEGTPFFGRRINNPDQVSVAYVTCHGVPHQHIDTAQAWLAPYREKRNERNRKMVEKINDTIFSGTGLTIDFERDVAAISMHNLGGAITERHITYALAQKLFAYAGKGEPLVRFLTDKLGLSLGEKQKQSLLDADGPYYDYTLLGILKSSLVGAFYIDAADECPMAEEFLMFTRSIGAIPAYSYLGDVTNSVTGDKKAQQFEDSFLDELLPWVKNAGFLALTYMPTRNTPAQLQKVMRLADELGLFQISGEDINSPTQGFKCAALELPEFRHLITSTWALIGHEAAAGRDVENGMFSRKSLKETPNLRERIQKFAEIGRG
ncbi:MAG TPA: PHP domain-containing protein [Clostridiales bacterium]|nr:PHP domain-containing protein [Clostridiales bacterium]